MSVSASVYKASCKLTYLLYFTMVNKNRFLF